MSRLPSFSTVSSGNAQLLQTVMVPRAEPTVLNGISYWTMKVDLCNIGKIYADSVEFSISGGSSNVIGDELTGVAIAGAGSDRGIYTSKSNIAGFGVRALGEPLPSNLSHGSVRDVVVMGESAAAAICNVCASVLIGTQVARQARNICGTVAIGDRAMFQGRGSNNVYIGTRSGYSNVGSGNVFIGHLAGSTNTTTSNQFILANTSNIENALVTGRFRPPPGPGALSYGIAVNTTLGAGFNFDVSSRARINGYLIVTGSSEFPGSNVIGGVTLSDTNVWTSGTISGILSNDLNTPNLIGGVSISNNNIGTTGVIRTTGTLSGGMIQIALNANNVIGGVSISNNNIGTTGVIRTTGTLSAETIQGGLATNNVIGGVSISNNNIGTTGVIRTTGTLSGGAIQTGLNGNNVIGGVSISNNNIGTTGVIRTTGTISADIVHATTISGNTVKGTSLVQSNEIGEVRIQSGTITATQGIQGAGIISTKGVQAIEGFTSPAGSTNTIGGVTIGPNGAVNTTGAITAGSINAGTITGTFTGTTTGTSTGTVTGAVNNLATTSNNLGGVILSNGSVWTQNTTSNARIVVRDTVAGTNLCRAILHTNTGVGGQLQLYPSETGFCNVARVEISATSNAQGGGKIVLRKGGTEQIEIVSEAEAPTGGGRIRVNDAGGLTQCLIHGGRSGAISNQSTSVNTLGGTVYVRNSLNSNTIGLFGTSANNGGAIRLYNSNAAERVTFLASDPNETNSPYLAVANNAGTTTFTMKGDDGAISNLASAFSVIGGMPITSNQIRNVGLVQLSVPGFNYLRGNLGYDTGGGYLTLNRSSDAATTITISGSSGAISNNAGSSNSIGGVTLCNSNIFAAGSSLPILSYLVLGYVLDAGAYPQSKYLLMHSPNTFITPAIRNRMDDLILRPRCGVIFERPDLTTVTFENTSYTSEQQWNFPAGSANIDKDSRYKAYFI